jgi:RNA polymerase sigma-70 factor (ECF subfamily)
MRVMDSAIAMVDTQSEIEALYRSEADRLWRSVYAFAGDPDVASDAVAEAYAQLLRRGEAVRDPAAWVWRAAFRISRGALKARRLADGMTSSLPEHWDAYADRDLLDAIRQLPDGQRAAVVLFYYADLPIRQIADRLGTNGLAVRANLSRGRRRLRQLLGDHDG